MADSGVGPRQETGPVTQVGGTSSSSSYQPMRRVPSKSAGQSLFRPRAMLPDDFASMMQEVVPQLLFDALQPNPAAGQSSNPNASVSAR